jgi:hypothetical protein
VKETKERGKYSHLFSVISDDRNNRVRHLLADVDCVNKWFASISFDHAYNEQDITAICPNFANVTPNFQPLSVYEVEAMLRKVSMTAPGKDNIPH